MLADLPGLLGPAQPMDTLETGGFFGLSRHTQDMVLSGGLGFEQKMTFCVEMLDPVLAGF